MRKIEILFKDIKSPKLTIAKDRIGMKFPMNFPAEKKQIFENLFLEIAEKNPAPEFTLRGQVGEFNGQSYISLKARKGKKTTYNNYNL